MVKKNLKKKENILILGVSSFSGATLENFLSKKNYKIIGTYNKKNKLELELIKKQKNLKLIKINLEKETTKLKKLINKFKPKFILDFASICMVNESWEYPEKYFNINLISRINIFNKKSNFKFLKKYIYISTPEIFGSTKSKIKEIENIYNPSTPYALSKMSVEIYLKQLFKYYGFPLIIGRFSNFYGPGQPFYRLIPKIIYTQKNNITFKLHGGGKSKRNFLYSSDFCKGIEKMLKKGIVGKTYHFSGSKFYSMLEIYNTIIKILKVKNPKLKISKDRIGKDKNYFLDGKSTSKTLNWKAKTPIVIGLKKTISFYLNNLNNFKHYNKNFSLYEK